MTQLTLAIAQGQNQAAACLEKTRQTVNDWPEKAQAALLLFVNQQKTYARGSHFTSEEAVAYCYEHGLIPAHDNRAFGGVFMALARKGVIRRSVETYRRANGHGSLSLKWEIV